MPVTPLSQSSTPLAYWVGFHAALLVLLAFERAFARRRARLCCDPRQTAIAAAALWIAAALAFAAFLRFVAGPAGSVQYLAGYAIEESLSIDNLFVFLLLFRLFQIERPHQPKVLFWGVAGAIVMRGLFIAGGITLLRRFDAISYIFAAILLAAAVRLVLPPASTQSAGVPRWIAVLKRFHPVSTDQTHFFAIENGRPIITILMLALIAIELSDVVFAIDSIPAVLSITRQPFLAYTSNIMAVMGLRSLYFLLIGMLTRLRYLHYGLAAILFFAGTKMLASRWVEIGPVSSLLVILGLLALTIGASLYSPGNQKD